jgi:hypothetical protein
MPLLRLVNTAQPLFPNQRSTEKILVLARQHHINYLVNGLIISILTIVPFFFIITSFQILFQPKDINGVFVRDSVILALCVYYVILAIFFMVTWIVHYYNILIVTDQRVVEIKQEGLFNRDINELSFEQVQDVSSHTHGILSTLFDAGDIEIQTAGRQPIFHITNVPRSNDVVSIIGDLVMQTKSGIEPAKRHLNSPICGIIGSKVVLANGPKPAIMNVDGNLYEASRNLWKKNNNPRTIREKLDYWWWKHKSQMLISFGPQDNPKDSAILNHEDGLDNF